MKIINKKNIIPIICVTYTLVSISLTIYEIIVVGSMNPTQLNIFLFLVLSILGVLVLSVHHYLDRFSTLVVIGIQYLLAVSIIVGGLWLASLFVDIHPSGYRDMIRSFSVPYLVGTIVYYVNLQIQIRKQNKLLAIIQEETI